MACAFEHQSQGRAREAVTMSRHVIEHWESGALTEGVCPLGPVFLYVDAYSRDIQ